ncbi:ABC transporter substrate-binding protein [Halalkalicoccus salilacus]|uniref:ABC transporter substrate-binding protein n=1 Tax=Halalkalicoccus salilacus TaxID=3117459 RepID=UPI00300E940B
MTGVGRTIDRRAFLAGVVGTAAGSAGCLGQLQASVDRDTPEQVSLSIMTVPADEDRAPVQIARHLAENLARGGIDATVQPVTTEQLLRDVLINHDFELYVGQYPGFFDPDYLYGLVHSRFAEEQGWQNPFGYANVSEVDGLLERQRQANDRETVLEELQAVLLEEAPFSVIVYPEEPRAIREDRYSGWRHRSLEQPLGYLSLDAHEAARREGDREADTLYMGITDRRITRNRNPFAVEFRHRGIIMGLMYDSLGRHLNGSIVPWLARDWEWNDGPRTTIRLRLREGLQWHDGEALTATDVAFTYRFLLDTTMSDENPVIPTPRFRSRSSLVESVEVIGDREVEFSLVDCREEVGLRALTVPLVPAHVWRERTDVTSITGVEGSNVTEALVWDNPEPVGSGPLQYADAIVDERLELTRFDDHFLRDELPDDTALEEFAGGPPYEWIRFLYSPSQANLVELLQAGRLDASAASLTATEVPRAERASNVSVRVERTNAHYHVGFNNRNAPLSNPRFRAAVARLVDREYLRTEIFEGFATPSLSPLGLRTTAGDEWQSNHSNGFAGRSGTGTVDETTAHELFREAGYMYNENDELVARQ